MSVSNFKEARWHVGHDIECVMYGTQNVSVECVTCNEVIVSYDRKEHPKKKGTSVNGNRDTRNTKRSENEKEATM